MCGSCGPPTRDGRSGRQPVPPLNLQGVRHLVDAFNAKPDTGPIAAGSGRPLFIEGCRLLVCVDHREGHVACLETGIATLGIAEGRFESQLITIEPEAGGILFDEKPEMGQLGVLQAQRTL